MYTAPFYFNAIDIVTITVCDSSGIPSSFNISINVINPPALCNRITKYNILKNKITTQFNLVDMGCISSLSNTYHTLASINTSTVADPKAIATIVYSKSGVIKTQIGVLLMRHHF
eukprot:TRINITY_DN1924_c0_g1_i1.p1 TRINITY_DN1924_c0_g1~~TRINITY_DN1924_c0_g1_i1.p1  ORF type:complete len:115 (-),score=22.39 TRINITY_DN1924_c0_g1_i1:65-409(-)